MADITSHMPGDILFYGKQQGDIFDIAISDFTQSPFVHVAIALSAVQKIEALGQGVVLTSIEKRTILSSWSFVSNVEIVDADRLHNALNWLIMQRGNNYGWSDDINAILTKVNSPFLLYQSKATNCSGLAEEFLSKAGFPGLSSAVDFHATTPASLAKLLNLGPGEYR